MISALALTALAAAAAAAGPPAPVSDDVAAAFSRRYLPIHRRGRLAYATSAPPSRLQAERAGFRFLEDLGCREPGDDAAFCASARPKAWTVPEIERVGSALEGFEHAGLAPFLRRVRDHGFDSIGREARVTHFYSPDVPESTGFPSDVLACRQFVAADSLFALPGLDRSLLHLLAHGIDFGARPPGVPFAPELSIRPEFLRMTGFAPLPDGRWAIGKMTPADREEFKALLALERSGRDRAGLRPRLDAFAARFGAPTFAALASPYEAFAEWVVAVRYDHAAAARLSPELARWIEDHALR